MMVDETTPATDDPRVETLRDFARQTEHAIRESDKRKIRSRLRSVADELRSAANLIEKEARRARSNHR